MFGGHADNEKEKEVGVAAHTFHEKLKEHVRITKQVAFRPMFDKPSGLTPSRPTFTCPLATWSHPNSFATAKHSDYGDLQSWASQSRPGSARESLIARLTKCNKLTSEDISCADYAQLRTFRSDLVIHEPIESLSLLAVVSHY